MTFVKAIMDFFGRKERETLMEFRDELKKLTDEDRREIALGLSKHFGEPIEVMLSNGKTDLIS